MTATFGHAAVDNFAVALVHADFDDDDITAMHTSGYHLSEIAERVAAQSGLDVTEAMAGAWLVEVGGFRQCQEPDGRGLCERPARPNTHPARCTACERTS